MKRLCNAGIRQTVARLDNAAMKPAVVDFVLSDIPRRFAVVGVVLAMGLLALNLWWWFVPSYGGTIDEATYFLSAKGLALHGSPAYRHR